MNILDFEIKEGRHILSGIGDYAKQLGDYEEDPEAVVLQIDGINYGFYVGPSDGYRSYSEVEELSDFKCQHTFSPQFVDLEIEETPRPYDDYDYILKFKDAINGKIVLEVGTEFANDYYPCAVFRWFPENLEINRKAEIIQN